MRGSEGTIEKVPSLSELELPIWFSPLKSFIDKFGSAVPVRLGVVLFVMSEAVVKEIGAFGAVSSFRTLIVKVCSDGFNASSVAIIFTE